MGTKQIKKNIVLCLNYFHYELLNTSEHRSKTRSCSHKSFDEFACLIWIVIVLMVEYCEVDNQADYNQEKNGPENH